MIFSCVIKASEGYKGRMASYVGCPYGAVRTTYFLGVPACHLFANANIYFESLFLKLLLLYCAVGGGFLKAKVLVKILLY